MKTHFAICCGLGLSVYASASPDPNKILADAVAACKALKSVRYTTKASFLNESATAEISQVFANVPDSGLLSGKYYMKGSSTDGTQLDLGYDGKTFRMRKQGKIEYVDSPSPYELGQICPMAATYVCMNFGTPDFSKDSKKPVLSYIKEETIGQWKCDVIQVTRHIKDPTGAEHEIEFTIAYDQKSHLAVQRKSSSGTTTVTKLLLNPKIDEGLFRLEGKEAPIDRHGPNAAKMLPIGSEAPHFTLKDAAGKECSLSDYRGKVVLLDFWATWCKPCLAAMPKLEAIHKKYESRGLAVIGVSVVEDPPSLPVFKNKGCTYRLLVNGNQLMKTYQSLMLPTVYVIDKEGKVAYRQAGLSSDGDTELIEVVESLLKR